MGFGVFRLGLDARGANWRLRKSLVMAGVAAGFALAAVGVGSDGGAARAQDGDCVDVVGGQVGHLTVTLSKSRTMCFHRPIANPLIGSPDIADIIPLTDSKLYVQGKKVGTTNISAFDATGQLIAVVDLEVIPDTSTLHSNIEASTGGAGIRVSSANGQVVLSGEASDAVAAARAVEVAKGLSQGPVIDAMKLSTSQQVMLKVRILEVDRNAARDLGVNLANLSGPNASVGGYSGLGTYGTATGVNGTSGTSLVTPFAGAAAAATPFGGLLANIVNTHGVNIDLLVSALETKNLVKSLAEPDLIALSGDTASFLAGGEIPVPSVQPGSGGGPSTVTVQYKDYGVELDFTPTVLANGLINLHLVPQVTEIDSENSVTVNGTTIPQLTKRSASTTVELRDGQSFAIAGLLQASVNEDVAQVPWLGSVPVIGALFRSSGFQKHETELVIIVSPHLVKPAPPGQKLASPLDHDLQANDIDLFLLGEVERKKKYTEYVTSGGDLKGPYGHILSAQ